MGMVGEEWEIGWGMGGEGGRWVAKCGRWRGPVGMWPVGWWSGTRMKECERWVKI